MRRRKVTPPSTNPDRAPEQDQDTLRLFFGPAPLLDGEDTADYNGLHKRVTAAVRPTDILEEIWVRDAVDLTWEIFRLRRLKVALFNANADGDSDEAASKWLAKNVDIVDRVDLMIARAEARRNAMLREVDRHRAVFSHSQRRSVTQIEEGNYRLIEDNSPKRFS